MGAGASLQVVIQLHADHANTRTGKAVGSASAARVSRDALGPAVVSASASVPASREVFPNGAGARMGVFSLRLDGGVVEEHFRKVHRILVDHGYDVHIAFAQSWDSDLQTLERLYWRDGTLLAVCTPDYAETSSFTFDALHAATVNGMHILPLRVSETFPPEPRRGTDHDLHNEATELISRAMPAQKLSVDCRGLHEWTIALKIAMHLTCGAQACQRQFCWRTPRCRARAGLGVSQPSPPTEVPTPAQHEAVAEGKDPSTDQGQKEPPKKEDTAEADPARGSGGPGADAAPASADPVTLAKAPPAEVAPAPVQQVAALGPDTSPDEGQPEQPKKEKTLKDIEDPDPAKESRGSGVDAGPANEEVEAPEKEQEAEAAKEEGDAGPWEGDDST